MPVTPQELARRLKVAREASGLRQEDAATHLGVSRPTVAQMEAGNRGVSSLELDRLAFLYGRDLREFVSDDFREDDPLSALFRAQPEVLEEEGVRDALRRCLVLGRELTNLEKLLGIDRDIAGAVAYPLPVPKNRLDAIRQGERVADQERRRLGLGWTPAPDVTGLLETQGVRTGVVDLPDAISGLTINDPQNGLFVVANRRHHGPRWRFSFAHEYAHVLIDRGRFGIVSRTSDRDDLLEVRANSFAAGFLIPEQGVRQFVASLGKGKPSRVNAEVYDEEAALPVEGRTEPGSQDIQLYEVAQLAHHFGVSRLAALYRLRNLRLISTTEFEAMKSADETGRGKAIAAHLGLAEDDERETREQFRHRFLGLALEAYRRSVVTMRKLEEIAEQVGITRSRLARLLTDAGLPDHEDGDVLLPSDKDDR